MRTNLNKIIVNQAIAEMQTIQDILRWTVSKFNNSPIYYGHGSNNSWDEAVRLTLFSLFLPLDIPKVLYSSRLTYNERSLIISRVIRRINQRIPVSYLTNKAWFCGLEFYVDHRVLIPRSPISELINDNFRNLLPRVPLHILDMCTGSGCIAIACAYLYPEVEVDAVDINTTVLAVTEKNIQAHNMGHRVIPICSDLFHNVPPLAYDLIITNPPYVDEEDMQHLPAEFYSEPVLGLAAGKDGLKLIRHILAHATNYLTKDGVLICEVGNSIVHLIAQYPQVKFHWITLTNQDNNIFMLTQQQLITYKNIFTTQS